jgi:hypothetical protein
VGICISQFELAAAPSRFELESGDLFDGRRRRFLNRAAVEEDSPHL